MLIWRVLRGYQLSRIAEAMLVHDCFLNCNGNAGIGARIKDNFAIRSNHFIEYTLGVRTTGVPEKTLSTATRPKAS